MAKTKFTPSILVNHSGKNLDFSLAPSFVETFFSLKRLTYIPQFTVIYIYIYIYIYTHTHKGYSISFQTFFVQAFKIVVDSWKFIMLLLYILWDDWPIFMISGSNEQLQQQLEYTLLKPDCLLKFISCDNLDMRTL